MTSYDMYVTLHVAGAIAWVGGSTVTQINGRRIIASGDRREIDSFMAGVSWMGPRFFIPISLVTIAFGIVSVLKGPWEFSEPWVSAGLTMFVISFIMGAGYMGPTADKLKAMAEKGEQDTPQYTGKIKSILMVSAVELLLLWAIVVLMVVKPG